MVKKIYYFECDTIKYLLSYLEKYSKKNFDIIKLDSSKLITQIDNNKNTYILFSNLLLEDIHLMIETINLLKLSFQKININIACGGAAHYMIDNEDLVNWFPEITHVCVGKGENFLIELIDNGLLNGIYDAKDFKQLKPYVVHKKYRLKERVLITFTDNRCNWGKCMFCHHQAAYVTPINSPEQLADMIDYYTGECGYIGYWIYDNNLNPSHLNELLQILYHRGYSKIPIDFLLFGLRVDSNFEILSDILPKWDISPITGGAWGVEFYDQEILDLYNKKINLAQADKSIDFFYDLGIQNYIYLLLGLPLVTDLHIQGLNNFIDKFSCKVESFMASYFLLSNNTRMFSELQKFKVIAGRNYTLRDYLSTCAYNKNTIPVKTNYLEFKSWDQDSESYLDRDTAIYKYSKILKRPKVSYKLNLYFLKEKTIKKLTQNIDSIDIHNMPKIL